MATDSLKTIIVRGLEGVLARAKQMPEDGPTLTPGASSTTYPASRPNLCGGALLRSLASSQQKELYGRRRCGERADPRYGLCTKCIDLEREDVREAQDAAKTKRETGGKAETRRRGDF